MCGFIAQLVEHHTGIVEVTGSNPVEALIFFRLLLPNCLNWKIHCDDYSSLSSFLLLDVKSILMWDNQPFLVSELLGEIALQSEVTRYQQISLATVNQMLTSVIRK